MIVILWTVTILLWMVAGAFAISDSLIVLALIHHRKDREFVMILGVVTVVFAMFAVGAAYGALAVGRCL